MSVSALGPQLTYISIVNESDGTGELQSAKIVNSKFETMCLTNTYSNMRLPPHSNEKLKDSMVRDVISSYCKRFRTGDSSLAALVQFLRIEIYRTNLLTGVKGSSISRAVDVINSLYKRCVHACTLHLGGEHTNAAVGLPKTVATSDHDSIEEFTADDLDWYFEKSTAPTPSISTVAVPAISTVTDSFIGSSQTSNNIVMSDEWFARALQHCLPDDYDSSISSSNSSSSSSSSCPSSERNQYRRQKLSLPTQLALDLIRPTSTSSSHNSDSFTILHAQQQQQRRQQCQKQHDLMSEHSLSSVTTGGLLSLQLVGVPTKYCTSVRNGLLFPIYVSDFEHILHCSEMQRVTRQCVEQSGNRHTRAVKKKKSIFDTDSDSDSESDSRDDTAPPENNVKDNNTSSSNIQDSSSAEIRFDRVAIIDCDHLHAGDSGEGAAISQTVAELNRHVVKHMDSSPSSFLSEQNERFQVYMSACIRRLEQHRVQLLICNDTNMDTRIIDACKQRSIAVLSVHTSVVRAFARLFQVWPAEDIVDIGPQSINAPGSSISFVEHCSFNASRAQVLFRNDLDGFAVNSDDCLEYTFHENMHSRNDNCLMIRCQLFTNARITQVHFSGVLFAAPSECVASAIEDRFNRCLYRLRAVNGGGSRSSFCDGDSNHESFGNEFDEGSCGVGGVCVGAGFVEAVMFAELQHMKDMVVQLQASDTKISPPATDESWQLITEYFKTGRPDSDVTQEFICALLLLIDAVGAVLSRYVVSVSTNCGMNSNAAQDYFVCTVRKMQQACKNCNTYQVDTNAENPHLLPWLQSLSAAELLSLPTPLGNLLQSLEGDGGNAVLDVSDVKKQVFSICMSTVLRVSRSRVLDLLLK